MLAAGRCGMPCNAIRLHVKALQFMKYSILKTMHGISETNYHGTAFAPLFGTGQGSGVSPAVWLTLIVLLLHSFDRLIPHQMNFVPISGARSDASYQIHAIEASHKQYYTDITSTRTH